MPENSKIGDWISFPEIGLAHIWILTELRYPLIFVGWVFHQSVCLRNLPIKVKISIVRIALVWEIGRTSLTLIGKFLGHFWDRFTGKLIQTKCHISYLYDIWFQPKKFEWMSFPVKPSVWRPGILLLTIGWVFQESVQLKPEIEILKNTGWVFQKSVYVRTLKTEISENFWMSFP